MKLWEYLCSITSVLLLIGFLIFFELNSSFKWGKNMMFRLRTDKKRTIEQKLEKYVTVSFGATCGGGGRMSNKLYEFVTLYGIARTLNRIPYANEQNSCIKEEVEKKMASYFPLLAKAIELKNVSENLITYVDFAKMKCCTYEDVGKLLAFNSSRYLAINGAFLQSFKYFDKYRSDVLKLLAFTNEDIKATDQIAKETFKDDKNHKVCVHIRRGDFVGSEVLLASTEKFSNASVFYVREKLMKAGKKSTVALLGDNRQWARALFPNYSWAVVPAETNRMTTDYAFFARHCQTIILTASASTFGFWSAYLSSAENVYYNIEYTKSDRHRMQLTPDDVFPPKWISLRMTGSENVISEVSS